MHGLRSTARRSGVLALGVLALHLLLIGGVADSLQSRAKPQPSGKPPGLAVRTLESTPAAPPADAPARPPPRSPSTEPGSPPQRAAAGPIEAPPPTRAHPVAAPPADDATGATLTARAAPQADAMREPKPFDPTRIPPAFAFSYTLTRGTATSEAELRWEPDGKRYRASLEGRDGTLFDWHSTGGFDAAGIAPERFVERRVGRGALAVNFQRDAGVVTFSGPRIEHPLAPGMQDRLSWLIQLCALAAADPARVTAAGASMIVVGARGDADPWRFDALGPETLATVEGGLASMHLLRQPARAYDTRAEVWLAASRDCLPLRVRLSNGGETLELQWRGLAPER